MTLFPECGILAIIIFLPHIHPLKWMVKKPEKKGMKADSIDKVMIVQLLPELEHTVFHLEDQPYCSLFQLYRMEFLDLFVSKGLINSESLALADDAIPVFTSHREPKHRVCDCTSKGITNCKCDRCFFQPDCDIGWDSSRNCYYHGFLHNFFRMKHFLSDYNVTKLLLDSAHDAMPYYEYCRRQNITPFMDLNGKAGIKLTYKNDFIIGKDGVPICKEGLRMNHDDSEPSKYRIKFRCPLAGRKYGCSCKHPCSDSKYGRTLHVAMKDNPRLFNNPPVTEMNGNLSIIQEPLRNVLINVRK